MSNEQQKPVIGISVGDLNGIGMEVIIKSLEDPAVMELCTPVVFASAKVAAYHRNAIDKKDFNFHLIRDFEQIHPDRPNLYHAWQEEVALEFGKLDPVVGSYAVKSLISACDHLDAGKTDALVTAPVHKQGIHSEDFPYQGHTDYLGARYGASPTMMLLNEDLRVALCTVHIPLAEVAAQLSAEGIEKRLNVLHRSLRDDFGLSKGRIAVLSVDPHAGDGGVIGKIDQDLVAPAVEKAFNNGILAFGPYPADSFFGSGNYRKFDAILAMYHDQGLIPFKTLSFGQGVNYSAGLPIVRTSPDHGTAFELAGKSEADPGSFRAALFAAIDLVRNRGLSEELKANPLVAKRKKRK